MMKTCISNKNNGNFKTIQKLVSTYTRTTGSKVRFYDLNHLPLTCTLEEKEVEESICKYCPVHQNTQTVKRTEPCHEMHINAIGESSRSDGMVLYTCEKGLLFWACPIFDNGRFAGALRGSGYLDPMSEKGTINDAFLEQLKTLPEGNLERIKSMAEMLLLYAASLSTGNEDHHEILRRRTEQQKDISVKIEELKKNCPNSKLAAYPIEKEQLLISMLRNGDTASALDILNDILAVLFYSNPNNFGQIQIRAIELAVLLSRVDIDSGQKGSAALKTNSRHIKQIKAAVTFEELTDIMHTMVKRITGIISSFRGIPHAAAMRKAERFIRENFTRKISLNEIASISGLSAPYFSTIFKEEMGENLSKYLNRLRVEKASRMLLETDLALSEISVACCFEDQSWFSRIFKTFTGISPGKYRNQGGGMAREISEDNVSEDYLAKLNL